MNCKDQASFLFTEGGPTGDTVLCSACSEEKFTTLLTTADEIVVENSLGKPASFRAGSAV